MPGARATKYRTAIASERKVCTESPRCYARCFATMIPLRILLPAAVTALLGCAASPAPQATPPPPPVGLAAAPGSSAVPAYTGGGAVKVDAEPVPGQLPSEADPTGGPGPEQATIVAETKRLRDVTRSCVTVPGALRTGRVIVTIAPNGRADRVVVKGHLEGTPEGGCVASAFRGFHVPPFVGEPVTVKLSISIP